METPRKFIMAIINLCGVIINLCGVSTKLNKYIVFTMQMYKELKTNLVQISFSIDKDKKY